MNCKEILAGTRECESCSRKDPEVKLWAGLWWLCDECWDNYLREVDADYLAAKEDWDLDMTRTMEKPRHHGPAREEEM